jgi:hypothetical protein
MLFNNDSMFIVTTVIVGGLFSYSFYNFFTITHNTPNTIVYNEVGIQTKSLIHTAPNIDTISELPETSYPVLEPNILHNKLYVETEVQTSYTSLWSMFKDWVKEVLNINSSDLGHTPTNIRVVNWVDNLDSTQIISSPTMNSVISAQNLVEINDSASNYGDITIPQLIDPTQIPLPIDSTSGLELFITTCANGRELVDPIMLMFG